MGSHGAEKFAGSGAARIAALGVWCAVALGGCVEERVVSNRPFLSGVPGAVTGRPVTPIAGAMPADAATGDELVKETPDGERVLIAKTGRQLMIHIYNTLDDNDAALFVDQVLSERTKQEFYQRGFEPAEAFKELRRRREDVDALFAAMPMGEQTPGVILRKVGERAVRMEVDGMAARGLSWRWMDMVLEGGNYRLRWFGP